MRLIDADELITAFPCGESVRTESVRATINHLPTIEVGEDCISREELPKVLNGVVLDDCDKIVDEFLEEHECDELWNAVRALRDFYEWTIDAPSVVPKQVTGKLADELNASVTQDSTKEQDKKSK